MHFANKDGDTKAFKHIYDQYKGRLFLFSLRFLKSEELAEEVVHDVFMKIWEERARLNPELSINSYLHTICKNMIFNLLKREARLRLIKAEMQNSNAGVSNNTEDVLAQREYCRLAEEAIGALPPKRRLIYRLCKEEGKSYQEAADELGISRNAVKDHLVKARKSITKFFNLRADIKIK